MEAIYHTQRDSDSGASRGRLSGMPLKVMTLNILMGDEERMPLLLPLIARENPDVLVLQECLGWEDGERLG
jgi:exodeoxyribonuclease-3